MSTPAPIGGSLAPAERPQQLAGVGNRPEVAQLVRVHDGADLLDPPALDVERHHADDASLGGPEHRPWLPVDGCRLDLGADPDALLAEVGPEAAHAIDAPERAGDR